MEKGDEAYDYGNDQQQYLKGHEDSTGKYKYK
jgi:hypothetical protein